MNDLIAVVENIVAEVNKIDIQEWLTIFSKHQILISYLGDVIDVDNLLTGFDSLNEINLDNFKLQIRTGLKELKIALQNRYRNIKCKSDRTKWKDKPHELLSDLIGCTEQCPFNL